MTNLRFRPPLTAYNLINLAGGVDKSKVSTSTHNMRSNQFSGEALPNLRLRPPPTAYKLINLVRGVDTSKV